VNIFALYSGCVHYKRHYKTPEENMNFVEPIRDRKRIAQIKNQLRGQGRYRDLLLFTVGINSALRISDLLNLRVHHFIDGKKW